MNSNGKVAILTGPTATGKTSLALELARNAPVEIVNADSMLVYREMNIGTAKPSIREREAIPHHLIDIRDPDEPFTAGDFVRSAHAAIDEIQSRGKRPLIVGGTGFYLKALLYGLWDAPRANSEIRGRLESLTDQALFERLSTISANSASRIGKKDRYRLIRAIEIFELTGKTPEALQAQASPAPDPRFELWVLDRPQEELMKRIHLRTREMMAHGLVDEVESIQRKFPESRALKAVGYAQVVDHLTGTPPRGRKIPPGLDGVISEIELATRQLVKRQRTWFKGRPEARWFLLDQDQEALKQAFAAVYLAPSYPT